MVLLSAEGWSALKIDGHVGYCMAMVRITLANFPATGLEGLRRKRPGSLKDLARWERVTGALNRLLGQEGDRVEHAPDAQVPEEDGCPLATDGHDAGAQAGSGAGRPGRADAGDAEKKSAEGRIRLGYLDECGFSPSQPTTLTWMRRGERKRMPYENPERRRLNVMALATQGQDAGALYWMTTRRHFGAGDFLHFLRELPSVPLPTVIVLHHVGFHRAREVRGGRADLRQRGIHLYYLPPYSPQLNDIERLFRTIKHHELPERRYSTFDALDAAVVAAFKRQEARRFTKSSSQPRVAA